MVILRIIFHSAKPFLITVQFSSRGHGRVLEEMAEIAHKYHQAATNKTSTSRLPSRRQESPQLRCQFLKALTGFQLAEYFTTLAIGLKDHKPALIRA